MNLIGKINFFLAIINIQYYNRIDEIFVTAKARKNNK